MNPWIEDCWLGAFLMVFSLFYRLCSIFKICFLGALHGLSIQVGFHAVENGAMRRSVDPSSALGISISWSKTYSRVYQSPSCLKVGLCRNHRWNNFCILSYTSTGTTSLPKYALRARPARCPSSFGKIAPKVGPIFFYCKRLQKSIVFCFYWPVRDKNRNRTEQILYWKWRQWC